MKAFHNDPSIKDAFLKRVIEHRIADRIIQEVYWENGRGCAVGCTLEGNYATFGRNLHVEYEKQLGIPMILSRLQDSIFEGLPKEVAVFFPEKFLTAIPVGADLSMIWPKFAVWMLTDPQHGVIKFAKSERTEISIKKVSELYNKKINGAFVHSNSFSDAANANAAAANAASFSAAASADSAASAAASADSAASAAAVSAADSAVYAAAVDAACAADANAYAAYAYADSASAADDASHAAYAAASSAAYAVCDDANSAVYASADAFFKTRESFRITQMEKLLQLLADEAPNAPLKT